MEYEYLEGYKQWKEALEEAAKNLLPPIREAAISCNRTYKRSHAEWEHAQFTGKVLDGALRLAHEEKRGTRKAYLTHVTSGRCVIKADWNIYTVEAIAQYLGRSESWVYENLRGVLDKWNGSIFSCTKLLKPYRDLSVPYYPVRYQDCSYFQQCFTEDSKLDCTKCPGYSQIKGKTSVSRQVHTNVSPTIKEKTR
jgi:hypothetical protein